VTQDLVPYGFNLDLWPQEHGQPLEGGTMGVWFTFEPERLDFLLQTLHRWFEERDEVVLVEFGTTDKQGTGCIMMEWEGCAIDQLFLDILRTDDTILDYATYDPEGDDDDDE